MNSKQSGMGLIELLVSLFLASIILLGLTQSYLSAKRQYNSTQTLLDVHFNVQWVTDLLSNSVRRAGFTPCLGINQIKAIDTRHNNAIVSALIIQPSSIQINHMSEEFTSIHAAAHARIIAVPSQRWATGQHNILIADCQHAEIHTLNAQGSVLTLEKPLLFSYSKSAYIGEWLEERWFIKTNTSGINSLYYKQGHTDELTPLIHSLKATVQQFNEHQLLHIYLGLDENESRELIVAVRGMNR